MYCSRRCKNKNTNYKHNTYQAQVTRAKSRKIQFIIALGGKCASCGYNKNLSALHFHHDDPSLKEMRLDRRIMSNYNMDRLAAEVAKCTLLCANCHAEHHHPNDTWEMAESKGIEPLFSE
jgi:hypothetical protein